MSIMMLCVFLMDPEFDNKVELNFAVRGYLTAEFDASACASF